MEQTNMLPLLEDSAVKSVENQRPVANATQPVAMAAREAVRGLTILSRLPTRLVGKKVRSFVMVKCNVCGKELEMERTKSARNASCGCFNGLTTHGAKVGYKRKRLYNIWTSMKQRILNPKNDSYKYYGGRGITICAEWMNYAPFEAWAEANGYAHGLEIDRREVNDGYSPSNCRWVTSQVNTQNRRITVLNYEMVHAVRLLSAAGMSDAQIAHVTKTNKRSVWQILHKGIWQDTEETGAKYNEMLSRMRANNPNAQ